MNDQNMNRWEKEEAEEEAAQKEAAYAAVYIEPILRAKNKPYSADVRDLGINIPATWYQSPLWRKEMQENAKATLAGDFSWVEKKFAEYVERAKKCTP